MGPVSITSQPPVSKWYEVTGKKMVADAILIFDGKDSRPRRPET